MRDINQRISFTDQASIIIESLGNNLRDYDVSKVGGVLVFFGPNKGYAFAGEDFTDKNYANNLNRLKGQVMDKGFEVEDLPMISSFDNFIGFQFRRDI